MSFLYNKKSQKAFKWVWIIFAGLIILSMVAGLFAVGAGGFGY
jgi:hypothetical protein